DATDVPSLSSRLENRYPSLGGSRVQIPPPPLYVTKAPQAARPQLALTRFPQHRMERRIAGCEAAANNLAASVHCLRLAGAAAEAAELHQPLLVRPQERMARSVAGCCARANHLPAVIHSRRPAAAAAECAEVDYPALLRP